MDPLVLLSHLKRQPPPGLPRGELAARVINENVFQLRAGGRHFLVKWVAGDNARGQNELRIGRLFNPYPVVPAPRLVFELAVESGLIAGWDWIEGHDLRTRDRDRLIETFSRLGEFHRMLRNQGEVVSPLSTARFAGVAQMLAAESYRLCAPFDPATAKHCQEIIARLEAGYPTLIHGDMHPGNVIVTPVQVWLVDWSYACNSLNLFDLDYIQSFPIESSGPAWAQVYPDEARLVLPAYFKAAGLEGLDVTRIHQAVMVWSLLRSYENAVKNGYRAEALRDRQQLGELLAHC